MQRKIRLKFIITGVLLALSILFVIVIQTVDVQPVGPQQSRVGLAVFNSYIFNRVGTNLLWRQITDWLGIAAILLAVGFGAVGIAQLIKRKSIRRVDAGIVVLGVFYILMVSAYLLFECFPVNYRPVILDASLEASFPSSHVMMVCFILTTAIPQFHALIGNKMAKTAAVGFCAAVMAVTVIGRFVSGVHWTTDIIGGLLIAAAFAMAYDSMIAYIQSKQS